MATLHEEVVVVKISKLVKNGDEQTTLLTEDVLLSLEAVVQELAGTGTMIEIQVA